MNALPNMVEVEKIKIVMLPWLFLYFSGTTKLRLIVTPKPSTSVIR